MFKVAVLLGLILGCFANNSGNYELVKRIEQGFKEYQVTRIWPSYLTEGLNQAQVPHLFRRVDRNDPKEKNITSFKDDPAFCTLCYTVANFLLEQRRSGTSIDNTAFEATAVCTLLGIEDARVCRGVIDRNINIFAYIADNNPDIKGERFCSAMFQNSGCNAVTFDWTIAIPEGQTVDRKPTSNPQTTINILQISDFHYDPNYKAGKQKDCSEPLCCQYDQEDGDSTAGTACGYWSEYEKADPSEALVDESVRKANEFDFDYVYFTGDIISHRVWETSVENNTKSMKAVFGKMKSAFKDKNVPIYPILGNHEPTPLNEYAIGDNLNDSLSTDWLYRLMGDEFAQWLPQSAQETIIKGGYYTVTPKKGFRIIALNSNVGYTMNWWLINNDTDPFGQLAWLVDTLKQAEDSNEIVHILSHIPSGKSDLLSVWSREYHRIVQRFANTIAAQFNGHTHHDSFMVYFNSSNPTQAINVAFNGASVIADKSNPSFKLFTVDADNYDVLESQEWYFNLSEANVNGNKTPNWQNLYNFTKHFEVSNLTPSAFTEFLPKLAAKSEWLYDYHLFRYRNSDLAVQWGCDDNCKRSYLCEISVSQVGDNTQCDWLIKIFNNS